MSLENYQNALSYINDYLKDSPTDGGGTDFIEYDSTSINVYNLYKFSDSMSCESADIQTGTGSDVSFAVGLVPSSNGVNSTRVEQFGTQFTDHDAIQEYRDSIVKSMLIALLDGNSKRTTNLSSASLADKKEIFYNCLRTESNKDLTNKPWVNWNDTDSTVSISSVSKTNGIVTVTTSTSHNLDTNYDDWGAVININNLEFDIPSSTFPNGVPITITGSNTFTYKKSGSDVGPTSVTGTADIKIGWGGSSINLHTYIG